jgi:hypothetical protein
MNTALRMKHKWIPMLSLVYLAIPILLFLSFWIKPVFSIPLIARLLYSLIKTHQTANPFQLEKTTQGKDHTHISQSCLFGCCSRHRRFCLAKSLGSYVSQRALSGFGAA